MVVSICDKYIYMHMYVVGAKPLTFTIYRLMYRDGQHLVDKIYKLTCRFSKNCEEIELSSPFLFTILYARVMVGMVLT